MTKPRYIANTSGKQPVDDDVVVVVRLRGHRLRAEDAMPAHCWRWNDTSGHGDIIAYRVIEQE
jgi:hypothetical protein